MPGGLSDLQCAVETNLEYSYGGGDPIPLCLAHILLEIQDLSQPQDIQEQEIVIRKFTA